MTVSYSVYVGAVRNVTFSFVNPDTGFLVDPPAVNMTLYQTGGSTSTMAVTRLSMGKYRGIAVFTFAGAADVRALDANGDLLADPVFFNVAAVVP